MASVAPQLRCKEGSEEDVANLDDAVDGLNPQVGCLAYRHTGGIIHNGEKERVGRGLLFNECGVELVLAGERPLTHVTPEVFFFRTVRALVESLRLGRRIERPKGNYPPAEDDGLGSESRRGVDRNAEFCHALKDPTPEAQEKNRRRT